MSAGGEGVAGHSSVVGAAGPLRWGTSCGAGLEMEVFCKTRAGCGGCWLRLLNALGLFFGSSDAGFATSKECHCAGRRKGRNGRGDRGSTPVVMCAKRQESEF